MKIAIKQVEPKKCVAGEYKATKSGFLFERLQPEGSKVTLSQEFLDEHKEVTGREFTSSWLELVKEAAKPSRSRASR